MNKRDKLTRDRLTLTRFGTVARVIAQLNNVEAAAWAKQEPSREMKQIIRTAFGK